MVQEEALNPIIELLNRLKIPYMLVGAIAVNYYSVPRFTHDADLVIKIDSSKIGDLCSSLGNNYYIDKDMIEDAIVSSNQFNLIHLATGFKIDFWILKKDKFSQLQFSRRLAGKIFGQDVFIISAEDLILTKLSWFKESNIQKHFFDAAGIYRMQRGILDMDYLSKYAKELGFNEIFQQVENEAEKV